MNSDHATSPAYIQTIPDRCRVCYTCVRECPAKAIRIENGQARIVPQHCIACGNCVRVCAKRAKQIVSSIAEVQDLLAGPIPVAACLAPSFPAEFTDCDYRLLIGRLRTVGFHSVHEVSFGADLTAVEYTRLLATTNGHRYISSTVQPLSATSSDTIRNWSRISRRLYLR